MTKCPGSEPRFITASEVRCPGCGVMVEMFSDEQRRRCPDCGARVEKLAVPSCAAWCSAARACVGAERYDALQEAGLLDDEKRDPETTPEHTGTPSP